MPIRPWETAFPIPSEETTIGLGKAEYFAGQALIGLCANSTSLSGLRYSPDDLSDLAWKIGLAMCERFPGYPSEPVRDEADLIMCVRHDAPLAPGRGLFSHRS